MMGLGVYVEEKELRKFVRKQKDFQEAWWGWTIAVEPALRTAQKSREELKVFFKRGRKVLQLHEYEFRTVMRALFDEEQWKKQRKHTRGA